MSTTQAKQELQKTQSTIYDIAHRRQTLETKMNPIFNELGIILDSENINISQKLNDSEISRQLAMMQIALQQLSSNLQRLNTMLSTEVNQIHQNFIDTNAKIDAVKSSVDQIQSLLNSLD